MSPALTGSSESVSSNPGGSATGMQMQQLSQVSCDRQFVTVVTEKQARVIALPSQNCVYKYQIADADFVVKSEVISMKGKCQPVVSFKYPTPGQLPPRIALGQEVCVPVNPGKRASRGISKNRNDFPGRN